MTAQNLKYRLKFMFQQIDLPLGEFTIGRSDNCTFTLEDALVSRQHAILVLSHNRATIKDLKSRNGTIVNDNKIQKTVTLHNNDRIRIGNQNLLFIIEKPGNRTAKKTGAIFICPNCNVPMVAGSHKCPHCGKSIPDKHKDDTQIGV